MKKIHVSLLLANNKIVFWKISPNKKENPEEFYKDFIYSGYNMTKFLKENDCSVEIMTFEFDEKHNDFVFDNLAKEFAKQWEISPLSKGTPIYRKEV